VHLAEPTQCQEDLQDGLLRWIVGSDMPFAVLDDEEFRAVHEKLISGRDMHVPHAKAGKAWVIEKAKCARAELKELLKVILVEYLCSRIVS
jgi:hypothetical protein